MVQEKKAGLARWVFRAQQVIADHRQRVQRPGRLPSPSPRAPGDTSAALVCKAVFEEVCILANGDVVCSCADSAGLRVYGNIRRDALADILGGPMYREMRSWQLESRPDRWCPAISQECPLRVLRATPLDTVEGRLPRMLQLEPTSHCNLQCPACPVTEFDTEARFAKDRTGMLTLAEVVSIFEQLPTLEKVLFYNYGEAFVHPEAIPMLRWLRQNRPGIEIHISTNGIALTPARVREVVSERLVDRMLFAIDGARPESYARYRVGGKLERALGAMRMMVQEAEKAGLRDKFEIWWQYILFEWDDTDEEIAEARAIAAEIGVPIEWVVTHTAGASKRFLAGSPELAALVGEQRSFRALSCDLKGAEIVRSQGYEALRHRAALRPVEDALRGAPGERRLLPLKVRHEGLAPWGGDGSGPFHLGVRLLDRHGRIVREMRGVQLPAGVAPGDELVLFAELELPAEVGSYHLMFDLVEDQVCWFSERGSTPALCALEVAAEVGAGLQPQDLVAPALAALSRNALAADMDFARSTLDSGGAVEDLLLALRDRGVLPLRAELAMRAQLGAALGAL